MSRHVKMALISLILFLIFLCFFLNTTSELLVVFSVAAVVFFLLFVGFLAISIGEKLCKRFSPYRIFAIVNGFLGVCVAAYAIYDIKTDVGWLPGLFGTVLLMFVMPIIVFLLIADFIVWAYSTRRKTHTSLLSHGQSKE